MTDDQLDAIEAALGLKLPGAYRDVSRAFPFRPIGRDVVYWFYNDPARVIGNTLEPLADGRYDRTGWQPGFVAIGHSPSGDPYVLDTATPGLPVLFLSHETHEIEPGWPTFEAFVAEWVRAPDEVERQAAEAAALTRARMRRGCLVAAIILAACVAVPLLMGLVLIHGRP
jgi:hypothetical protein